MFYALASVWRQLQPLTEAAETKAQLLSHLRRKTRLARCPAVRETTMMCSLEDVDHMYGGLTC